MVYKVMVDTSEQAGKPDLLIRPLRCLAFSLPCPLHRILIGRQKPDTLNSLVKIADAREPKGHLYLTDYEKSFHE